MRVAVVHSFYDASRPSGENEVVLDQSEQLARSGYEVQLIARHTSEEALRPFYSVTSAITVTTGWGRSPAQELAAFAPDVVHLHNTFPNWGTHWLRRWGPRTVATMHNFRPLCANGLLFRDGHPCTECLTLPVVPAVRHACYRSSAIASLPLAVASSPVGALHMIPAKVARVITLNDMAAGVFRTAYGREVDVVPNFVPAASDTAPPTRAWIYVGRLSEEKGIRQLLDIWPSDTDLDVVGSGPLAALVQDHAARHQGVRFLGSLPRDEVLSRLSRYTGLVLPSMCAEGLPLVMLEALAAGVPLVVSDRISTAKEVVSAGAGLMFDPTGGTAMLRHTLTGIEEGGPRMRTRAGRLHHARYSARAWQGRIDQIYTQVCSSAPRVALPADDADFS